MFTGRRRSRRQPAATSGDHTAALPVDRTAGRIAGDGTVMLLDAHWVAAATQPVSRLALFHENPRTGQRLGEGDLGMGRKLPVEWAQVAVQSGEQADPVLSHPLRGLVARLVLPEALLQSQTGEADIEPVVVSGELEQHHVDKW